MESTVFALACSLLWIAAGPACVDRMQAGCEQMAASCLKSRRSCKQMGEGAGRVKQRGRAIAELATCIALYRMFLRG